MAVPTAISSPKYTYTFGDSITVNLATPESPTYSHTYSYHWPYAGDTLIDIEGLSFVKTTSTSDMNRFPSQEQGTLVITVDTWSEPPFVDFEPNPNAVKIGTNKLTFALIMPAGSEPSITSLTLTEATPAVLADAGVLGGNFIEGLSTIAWDFNALPSPGASITTYNLVINGKPYLGETGTTPPLVGNGTWDVTGQIVDSRGMTADVATTITVMPYQPPKITAYTAQRTTSGGVADDNGTYITVAVTWDNQNIVVGSERNYADYTIRYRVRGAGSWTTVTTVTNAAVDGSDTETFGPLSTTTAYEVRFDINDMFGQTNAAVTYVSKATIVLDMGDGTLGVGKLWANGVLDVGGDIYTTGQVVQAADTGWVDLSSYMASGAALGRNKGGTITIRGTIDTDVNMGTTLTEVMGTPFPAIWRPAGTVTGAVYSSGYSATLILRSAGTMAVANRNVANLTGQITFSVTFVQ